MDFDITFIDKNTGEEAMSTTGTMSSIENSTPARIPKVLEIPNIIENRSLYDQLITIEDGIFSLEVEGVKVGKYSLIRGEKVIRLVEVVEFQ